MKKSRLLGAVCACVAVVSINTSAAIINVDWQTAGDNLITRDTTNGLEWLDVTVTARRTYDDISAKFGAGQEFEGWRYATQSEVAGFFDSFGGDSTFYYSGWSVENNGLFDAIAVFWGDIGCPPEDLSCAVGDGFSGFVTSEVTWPLHHNVGIIDDYYGSANSMTHDYVHLSLSHLDDNETFHDYGSALVRVVPVPAAVWLFGSGLLGLVGMARRKKAA